jgi:hypothetical protein
LNFFPSELTQYADKGIGDFEYIPYFDAMKFHNIPYFVFGIGESTLAILFTRKPHPGQQRETVQHTHELVKSTQQFILYSATNFDI